MDDANFLPTDLAECHHLLLAAYRQAVQLEQRTAEAQQRVAESEQRVAQSANQVAELGRVLDATSASFQDLQQEHAGTLEELAWYKRWVHGRRRERIEGEGQQHLFDLARPGDTTTPAALDSPEPRQEIAGHM